MNIIQVPRLRSQLQINQMQLCDELTKLNSSLKLELQKCHNYINTLQKDLQQAEEKSNYSIISENLSYISQNLQNQNLKLKTQIDRLSLKNKQKRTTIKTLQKHCQGLEVYIHQTLKQKQQLQKSLTKFQYLIQSKNNEQTQAIKNLQSIIGQQKDAIVNYNKQLLSQTVQFQKMISKIQIIESQRNNIIKQNQRFKMINVSLSNNLKEADKNRQQKQLSLTIQIRQLQSKNIQLINQINGLNLYKQKMELMMDNKSKAPLISKKIMSQEYSIIKELQSQNKKLAEQIKMFQQQKKKQKEKLQWLKNDLITIKLQNSCLINKNKSLVQQKQQLEKYNHQLLAKNFDSINISSNKQVSYEIASKSFNSFKSCNKTLTSIQSMSTKKISKVAQDGQIPVHDKGYINNKSSIIYLSNNPDPKKNGLIYRKNIVNFTALR